MDRRSKIYVAGHKGMVGSAIIRKLNERGYDHITVRTSSELDLRNQQQVFDFFQENKPEYIFLAAAKVGGINANNLYRAEFIYDNLAIESNIIHASWQNKAKKLLFLGSSCIYPKLAPQPLKESYLLTGPLEYTNEPYAIAKIAGIKLCESYRLQYGCNFISLLPTNLYGPKDNYDLENSHVLPAMLRKFHTAKARNEPAVEIWGTGTPLREFLHVDDLAEASIFLMENYNEKEPVNVGSGTDISIRDLALLIKDITDYRGDVRFNPAKPDGTPRKLLDMSKIHSIGWKHRIELKDGIREVYKEAKKLEFTTN